MDESSGSSEVRLMLLSARSVLSDRAAIEIGKLIECGIDWTVFTELLEVHRVLPLVYTTLKGGEFAVPEAAEQQMRRRYLLNVQSSFALTRSLAAIVERFALAGVATLPFKGPVLAQTIYSNVALRQAGDLDILVKTKDIDRASDLLVEMGYSMPLKLNGESHERLHVGHLVESARTQHYEFFNASGIVVELHKGIGLSYLRFGLNNEEIWSLAEPLEMFGQKIYSLPPTYTLLSLIHHGSKHGWYCLSWVCDIAEFIRHTSDFDWAELIRISTKFRMSTMTKVALLLAASSLDSNVPGEVLDEISNDRNAMRLTRKVQHMHSVILAEHSYERYEFAFNCVALDHLSDRVRYMFLRATTPSFKEWDMVPLPLALSGLYHVVRPLRIAGEVFGIAVEKLRYRLRH